MLSLEKRAQWVVAYCKSCNPGIEDRKAQDPRSSQGWVQGTKGLSEDLVFPEGGSCVATKGSCLTSSAHHGALCRSL